VEFWVHCSNIQAWADFNYDTRILQDYLAFGILKKLTDNEVKDALIIFKEEIIKRLKSGWEHILFFFLEENYITSYLSEDDLFSSLLNQEEARAMKVIAKYTKFDYTLTADIEDFYNKHPSTFRTEGKLYFSIENSFVSGLEIQLNEYNQYIINCLFKLPRLDQLYIFHSYIPKYLNLNLQDLGFELMKKTEELLIFHKHNF